jgi:hypothetical protein
MIFYESKIPTFYALSATKVGDNFGIERMQRNPILTIHPQWRGSQIRPSHTTFQVQPKRDIKSLLSKASRHPFGWT